MTCPDWSHLAAHRLANPASVPDRLPEGWTAALDHLDRCPECRRRAVAADPTLVFRSLPRWEPEVGEVEAMRSGVAALRRAHRVAPRAADGLRDRPADGSGARAAGEAVRSGGLRISGTRSGWRAAAAAALAAALLSVAPVSRHAPARGSGGAAATPVGHLNEPARSLADLLADSTVDDIEHPTASVYHIDDEEVGVVMVVDAGLDV